LIYSFDTSINKILQDISQLINIIFEKILDNVGESNVICWQIVSVFVNSLEIYILQNINAIKNTKNTYGITNRKKLWISHGTKI